MHPLNSRFFGPTGMAVSYYDGTSVVTGYVTKQVSYNRFDVTDGTTPKRGLHLAPTTTIAQNLSTHPTYFTIPLHPFNSAASGATFTVHYGVESATVVTQNGTHWNVSDTLALPSGAGSLTVATVGSGLIATVTIGAAGNYTSLFSDPVTCTRAAGASGTFTPHYAVDTAIIAAGGAASTAGYTAGDTLTLATTGSATIIVDTVDGGGGILTFHVGARGDVTALASNPRSVTGGTGTGATFTLKYRLLSVTSSGGSGYNVGDTLTFTGLTATTAPTAHISVATSHAATTVVVDTAGVGITAAASGVTTSTTTATFHLKYHVLTVASSGGSGYVVSDTLLFGGMVAVTLPTAHIATSVATAASSVTVDSAGVGITTAASSVSVSGVTEYVMKINEKQVLTTAGNGFPWALGAPSVENSAYVPQYSE
jgi:hypothetical protein